MPAQSIPTLDSDYVGASTQVLKLNTIGPGRAQWSLCSWERRTGPVRNYAEELAGHHGSLFAALYWGLSTGVAESTLHPGMHLDGVTVHCVHDEHAANC